jgi:hypothetical protein
MLLFDYYRPPGRAVCLRAQYRVVTPQLFRGKRENINSRLRKCFHERGVSGYDLSRRYSAKRERGCVVMPHKREIEILHCCRRLERSAAERHLEKRFFPYCFLTRTARRSTFSKLPVKGICLGRSSRRAGCAPAYGSKVRNLSFVTQLLASPPCSAHGRLARIGLPSAAPLGLEYRWFEGFVILMCPSFVAFEKSVFPDTFRSMETFLRRKNLHP